jgi:hypothetical protein
MARCAGTRRRDWRTEVAGAVETMHIELLYGTIECRSSEILTGSQNVFVLRRRLGMMLAHTLQWKPKIEQSLGTPG